MDAVYFDRLTPTVQDLILRVEDAMGVPIDVRVDPRWDHLGCNIENRRPQVLTPAPDYFPDGSVVHELLHIRRVRTEGVPQIVDNADYPQWNPAIPKALSSLDNSLEHLVIVPEEIALRPERRNWWESDAFTSAGL